MGNLPYVNLEDQSAYLPTVFFYPLPHESGRVLCFQVGLLCVCPSNLHPSVLLFLDDNLSERQWILTKKSDSSFLDNNLSKYQWIYTNLGMCIAPDF